MSHLLPALSDTIAHISTEELKLSTIDQVSPEMRFPYLQTSNIRNSTNCPEAPQSNYLHIESTSDLATIEYEYCNNGAIHLPLFSRQEYVSVTLSWASYTLISVIAWQPLYLRLEGNSGDTTPISYASNAASYRRLKTYSYTAWTKGLKMWLVRWFWWLGVCSFHEVLRR